MKLKHFSIFKQPLQSLDSATAWETLRTDHSEPQYHIPETFSEYAAKLDELYYTPFAKWVIGVANEVSATSIFSVGCGKGYLEYQIKKIKPSLKVTISDYTNSVLQLETYNTFDQVIQLDIFNDILPVGSDTLLILPRIDTEFSDEQFIAIIKKCHDHGFERVCFIPAQLLSFKIVIAEMKVFIKALLTKRKRTFCGYSRSSSLFRSLMTPYYKMEPVIVSDKKVFILSRIN